MVRNTIISNTYSYFIVGIIIAIARVGKTKKKKEKKIKLNNGIIEEDSAHLKCYSKNSSHLFKLGK